MPRTFTRITTSIWRSRKFIEELTLAQQGAYFMLESQGEITAAGTLALTERRWAKLSKGTTPISLRSELDELVRTGHVLIDDDTEEVLVIKFVRFDGGYTNTKRIPVIRDAARAIVSPKLRAALAAELRELGLTDIASSIDPDSPPDTPSQTPRHSQPDSPPDAVSPSERVGVTSVGNNPNPQTATSNPQPLSPEREPSGETAEPPAEYCPQHPNGTDEPCGACAGRRRRRETWLTDRAQRQATHRTQLAEARLNCTHCNPQGWIEGPDGELLTRCTHPTPPAGPVEPVPAGRPIETAGGLALSAAGYRENPSEERAS